MQLDISVKMNSQSFRELVFQWRYFKVHENIFFLYQFLDSFFVKYPTFWYFFYCKFSKHNKNIILISIQFSINWSFINFHQLTHDVKKIQIIKLKSRVIKCTCYYNECTIPTVSSGSSLTGTVAEGNLVKKIQSSTQKCGTPSKFQNKIKKNYWMF